MYARIRKHVLTADPRVTSYSPIARLGLKQRTVAVAIMSRTAARS